jgi:hypothetical protein
MMIKTCEHHLSVYGYGVSRATCGSYQEELPSNIRKGRRCRLQIHEIGEGDSGNSERDALGAEVVGKDLAVEDHAGDVDAAAIEEEEDVAIVPVRFCTHGIGERSVLQSSNTHPKAGNVGHRRNWTCERRYNCGLNDQTGATTYNASDHKRLAAGTIHNTCLDALSSHYSRG